MKYILIFLSACFVSLSGFAQKAEKSEQKYISNFIFPAFVMGTVQQKAGTVATGMMNYNVISQEMIFEEGGKRLAMLTAPIDAVYIGDRKFIPVGKVFYEEATDTQIPLFIQHAAKSVEGGKPAGYGSTSETTNINTGSTLDNTGVGMGTRTSGTGAFVQPIYSLDKAAEMKILDDTKFWVKKNNRFFQISNVNQVIGIFSQKESSIKDFVAANKIKFDRAEDVKKLIVFCNNP